MVNPYVPILFGKLGYQVLEVDLTQTVRFYAYEHQVRSIQILEEQLENWGRPYNWRPSALVQWIYEVLSEQFPLKLYYYRIKIIIIPK